jgi:hypothetical protein
MKENGRMESKSLDLKSLDNIYYYRLIKKKKEEKKGKEKKEKEAPQTPHGG